MLCGCHCQVWWLNDTTKWGDEELCSKATTRESWKWKTDLNHRKHESKFAGIWEQTYTHYISSKSINIPLYHTHHTNIEMIHLLRLPHLPSRDRVCEPTAASSPGGQRLWSISMWSICYTNVDVHYCILYKIIIVYHIYSRYLMSLGSCSSSTTTAMTFRGPGPPVGLTGTGTCAAASLGVVLINS